MRMPHPMARDLTFQPRYRGTVQDKGFRRQELIEMKLSILAVPDCPNAPLLRDRITRALAGQPATEITWHEVTDGEQAECLGMHGSPTLLIDGIDPFALPGQLTSLSCRLYRDLGTVSGAPSTDQLRGVLQAQRG